MNKLVLVCLAITMVLTGCNEFEKLSIAQENGEIVFFIDKETLEDNQAKSYIIEDFGVAKKECKTDCVMWEIVNKADSEQQTGESKEIKLKYGETLKNMETRHAALELKPDSYTAGGIFSLVNKENKLNSKVLHESFEVIVGSNGSIKLQK